MQSGSATEPAILSNSVDIGFSSLVPLAIAHTKNIPFVMIAPGAQWTQAAKNSGLYVGPASTLRTGKDLNGKTLGTAGLGTLTEYATRAWIEQNGGDPSTVKFVEMGYSLMPPALAAGRIDGSIMNEPYFSVARKDDRLIGYPYDAVAKEFLIGAWFTTNQWAKDNPDAVDRFVAAIHEATVWANQKQNQAKSGEILSKYTKLDPSLIASMVRVHFAERLDPAQVQPQVDVSAKYASFHTFPAQELIFTRSR